MTVTNRHSARVILSHLNIEHHPAGWSLLLKYYTNFAGFVLVPSSQYAIIVLVHNGYALTQDGGSDLEFARAHVRN